MIQEKLLAIQIALKAPKGNYNTFGKYKYRSCEDIFEAVKPILNEVNCTLNLSDELVNIGERYYIKATARLVDNKAGTTESANGYAREAENQKGFDQMQLTGSTSSYARKYALNGLFLIDDTKDSDFSNTHGKDGHPETISYNEPKKKRVKKSVCAAEQTISKNDLEAILQDCTTIDEVTEVWWKLTKEQQEDKDIKNWFTFRKGQINE